MFSPGFLNESPKMSPWARIRRYTQMLIRLQSPPVFTLQTKTGCKKGKNIRICLGFEIGAFKKALIRKFGLNYLELILRKFGSKANSGELFLFVTFKLIYY